MRGSAGAPARWASRSDQAPAQTIARRRRAARRPRDAARRPAGPSSSTAVTGAARRTSPPGGAHVAGVGARRRRRSRRSRSPASAARRRRPRAARPRAAPRRRASAGPGTPLALPRRSSSRRPSSSSSASATISLPQRSCGDPALGAERVQRLHACDAEACLERAGRVVDAGVHDAGVVARLVRRRGAARARARRPGGRARGASARGRPPGRGCHRRRPRCRRPSRRRRPVAGLHEALAQERRVAPAERVAGSRAGHGRAADLAEPRGASCVSTPIDAASSSSLVSSPVPKLSDPRASEPWRRRRRRRPDRASGARRCRRSGCRFRAG